MARGDRRDVDDAPSAACAHLGHHRLNEEEHALQVDVEIAVPVLLGGLVERHLLEDADAVDQQVDGAEIGLDLGGEAPALRDLAEVGPITASASDGALARRRIRQRELSALGGESLGDLAADAAHRARD